MANEATKKDLADSEKKLNKGLADLAKSIADQDKRDVDSLNQHAKTINDLRDWAKKELDSVWDASNQHAKAINALNKKG